jgi:ligand-binding sensor domain-containing protein/signal transduction histidine kinase
MQKLFAYIGILLLIVGRAHARVTAVDAGVGLTDKYITAICKDGRGLLWIGTKQGLCTYDGYRFEPLGGALQSGNAVARLLYDASSETVWVASDKGLFAVAANTRLITQILHKEGWSLTPVSEMSMLPDHTVYAAYREGEIASVDKGKRLNFLTRVIQQSGMRFFNGSMIPFGPDAIDLRPYGQSPSYLLYEHTNRLQRNTADTTTGAVYFRKSQGDTLFIGRSGGSLEIRSRKDYRHLFPESMALLSSADNIIDVRVAAPGRFYLLCKPSNLYYIDLISKRVDTISSEVFSGRLSTCFYNDQSNVLWVGTNKGLIKVTNDRRLFTHMLFESKPISIRSIVEDEGGNLYAGTYSGLFRLAAGDTRWRNWSGMLPYAMLNMPGRYLYFVGEQRALFRVDKQNLKVETGFYKTRDMPQDELRQAYAMASNDERIIWIGTSYGLAVFYPATNTLSAFKVNGLPNTEVRYIRILRDRHLWVCTRSGLYEVDPQKGILWQINMTTKPALTANTVNYIDEDKDGRLWLCTDGGGINIISKDRTQVSVLKTEDGLSDNTTYQLAWQNPERIWISTFNGLSTYDLQHKTFYNYYVDDGLTNNEFNHNAFLRESSGRILFGSINGINAFYPDSIPKEERATRLFASTITKWDNKAHTLINLHPEDTGRNISLGPLDHSLTFNLALTDYHNPENEIFLYRIQGLFDEWVSLNSERSLRLDGLAPGDYVLEIKAIDSRGVPAVNTLSYQINVAQPFFKSWWFYLGLFLVASGLLWAFFFLRLQNIKRVQHLREQIASDLHDEVGSLLTRITMTSDNLRYSSHSESDRVSKLQKIASLSRSAASSMSDILWAIDARNDYTGNLADRMREHAEEMLMPLGISLEFDFVVNQRMSIPSSLRQQLYLIYKEAINNIVKHSRPTGVQIHYHHNELGFKLSIVNNGCMEKGKFSSKGQGLKNIRMRAKKIHAHAAIYGEDDCFNVAVTGI